MHKPLSENLTHWKPVSAQEQLAWRVLKLLVNSGFPESYIVGGYVRDRLLGKASALTIDIATAATPTQVQKLFLKPGFKVIPTGLKHGTVTVINHGEQVEITTFRTEGKYEDFRRPKAVKYVATAKADAGRRDFTINALYFNPVTGKFLDFYDGIKDLQARRLRFIGSAKARIAEDALRLLRAVRFAADLGFRLTRAEKDAIKSQARLIKKISAERIKQELDKIMASPGRVAGLRLLYELRLLSFIIPEIARLAKVKQSKNYHSEGNVFVHTLLALSLVEQDADLTTLYGLLFHDIGKGSTGKATIKHGRRHISFTGHPEKGEMLVKKILKRLKFSNKEIEDIAWYVRNHHIPVALPQMRRAKQMRWCLEPRFKNLLQIFRADSLASIPTDTRGRKQCPSLDLYDFAIKISAQAVSQKVLTKRFVTGVDVMRILKIKPGPRVGKILRDIEERQLGGKIKNRKQALQFLQKLK